MKTIGIIAFAFVILVGASTAISQTPHFRIYFDDAFTVDAMDCPGPFMLDTLYVVAVDFDSWVVAVEYEINFPTEIIFLGNLDPPSLTFGDPTTGVSAAWTTPQDGSGPLLVQKVIILYNCSGDCTVKDIPIRVMPHPVSGELRAVRWPDMEYVDAVPDSVLGKNTYLCPTPPYDCAVTPTSIDFDSVLVGSTKDTTFTIYSLGTMALIDSVRESCAHYSIVSGGGPYNIPPGDSLVVGVRFEPTAVGTHGCSVETGRAECDDVSLTGYGEPPPVCSVSPTSIDYGLVFAGSTKDTTFVVKNTGGGSLDGDVGETCPYYNIESGAGAFSLAHNESLLVTVRYAPTSPGTHTCWIETGTALCDSVFCTGDADDPPVCEVTPTSLDIGFVFVGSSKDTTFVVRNTGGGTVDGDVSETCPYYTIESGAGLFSLAASESLLVTVRYAPTSPGTHTCWIETGTALCDSVFFSGDADDPPVCEVVPTSLDVGFVYVGSTKDTTFVVRNTGGVTVDGDISETCPYYNIESGAGVFSLARSESLVVTVRYTPTTGGTHTCWVETGTSLCDSVFFSGGSDDPPLCLVDPTALDFGIVPVGNSKDMTFEVKNTGGSTLDGDISESCAHYNIASGGGLYSLAAGESLLVSVRFQPTAEGTHNCTVETGQAICADVSATGQSPPEPLITSIVDVGNDQGRNVRMLFLRSSRDINLSSTPILQYEAFRRVDPLPSLPGITAAAAADSRADLALEAGMLSDPAILAAGWEFAAAVPAHVEPDYYMIAPTLTDSTISNGMHWSVFFVRAATADPGTYFDSPVDSGYSVDNLAPGVPQGFSVAYNAPGGNELVWDPSGDADFQYFNVYRSTDPEFVPGPGNRVHSTIDDTWVDGTSDAWMYSYKITAVDFSGNESDPAPPDFVTGTGGDSGVPAAYALNQNVPNPFNPMTLIHFGVPDGGGDVTLRVYDVGGRLVRTLIDGPQTEGWKSVGWDATDANGRRIVSGVYFYRMTAPGFVETKKMVLLR